LQKYKIIRTFASKIEEKMQFFIQFVRKYPFSVLCIVLIWVLSLTPFFPETPLDDVQFIDKWTHLVMYGGTCSVIWFEYMRHHSTIVWRKVLLLAVVGVILLGGLMELLQAYCTTIRSGEWLDFWADTAGVLLGNALGLGIAKVSLGHR
jgi:VanZ family protein